MQHTVHPLMFQSLRKLGDSEKLWVISLIVKYGKNIIMNIEL